MSARHTKKARARAAMKRAGEEKALLERIDAPRLCGPLVLIPAPFDFTAAPVELVAECPEGEMRHACYARGLNLDQFERLNGGELVGTDGGYTYRFGWPEPDPMPGPYDAV